MSFFVSVFVLRQGIKKGSPPPEGEEEPVARQNVRETKRLYGYFYSNLDLLASLVCATRQNFQNVKLNAQLSTQTDNMPH